MSTLRKHFVVSCSLLAPYCLGPIDMHRPLSCQSLKGSGLYNSRLLLCCFGVRDDFWNDSCLLQDFKTLRTKQKLGQTHERVCALNGVGGGVQQTSWCKTVPVQRCTCPPCLFLSLSLPLSLSRTLFRCIGLLMAFMGRFLVRGSSVRIWIWRSRPGPCRSVQYFLRGRSSRGPSFGRCQAFVPSGFDSRTVTCDKPLKGRVHMGLTGNHNPSLNHAFD